MRITGLMVKNFRSIEQLNLDGLGNLNIFVGKNNSGKSTVLNSIDVLTKAITTGIVTSVFQKKDYHNANTSQQIILAGSFLLEDKQYDKIFNAMKEDHHQLDTAIENLKTMPFVNLYVTSLNVVESEHADVVTYIEKVTISGQCPFSSDAPETVLLRVNPEVVRELVQRSRQIKTLNETIKDLQNRFRRVDPEEFRMLKERGRMVRRTPSSDIIANIVFSANDIQDFRRLIREEITNAETELDRISREETRHEFVVFAGQSKQFPNHINVLLKTLEDINILRESERKKPIEYGDAQRLLDLKVTRGGEERLNQLRQIVGDLLGVRLDAFRSNGSVQEAEIDIDDFLVDMNGAGIRESLRLILDLEFSNPQIILLEEPEVHLHFELEKKLFKYLVQIASNRQIFLTTHSTGFIDSSGTNNVFLVRKNQSTLVTPLTGNDISEIIYDLGINISSLLLSKVLIFVEGPTDELIIRSYFESFYSELSYADVSFVKMTGVGNYRYYANANALNILHERGLLTVFVIDSDSMNSEERERLERNHPQSSTLFILPVRCVENFFLKPDILAKFINKKLVQSGLSKKPIIIDEKQIKERLNRIVDGLLPETTRLFLAWKYMKPIYPNSFVLKEGNLVHTTEEAIEWIKLALQNGSEYLDVSVSDFETNYLEELKIIQERWKKEKMSIVPGDKVLDNLCAEYGLRYHKAEVDIDLLTQPIAKTEWPEHLMLILDEIASTALKDNKTIFEVG